MRGDEAACDRPGPGSGVASASNRPGGVLLLLNFGVAKTATYLAPFAIAALVPPAVYAGFEWSLAAAFGTIAVLTGAPLQALAKRRLVRQERIDDEVLLLAALACGGFAAAGMGALWLSSDSAALPLAVTAAVAMQVIVSEWARAGRPSPAVAWLDGSVLLLCAAIVAVHAIDGRETSAAALARALLGLSGTAALLACLALRWSRRPAVASRLIEGFASGLSMMLASLFGIWLAVSGRLLIGIVAKEDLAAYAFAFRCAGTALIVHQIVLAAFYRRVYTARTRDADRLLAGFLAGGWALAASIALAGPSLAPLLDIRALDAGGTPTVEAILPIVALQTGFWVGYAMLQARVYRFGLAASLLAPAGIVAVAGAGSVLAVGHGLGWGVEPVCWILAAQSAACYFLALALLARKRLPHRRMTLIGILGGGILTAIALLPAASA